jgi:adenylate cyclase
MPSIRFLIDGKKVRTGENGTILETALGAGIPIAHICQGNGRCSTCRIQVVEGLEHISPRTQAEQAIADHMSFAPDIRLACQTRVNGNIKVRRLVFDDDDIEMTSLLIQELGANPAGIEKEVLILFADIRGFTALTERLLAYDVVHILNRYFRLMNKVITKHGGQINSYLGDGFMALFEVKNTEEDVLQGVRASLEMLDVVHSRIRPYVKSLFNRGFRTGIGLHYGLVVAGTIGTRENARQTIIGDAVNFTQRIEASNKKLGTEFLISQDIYTIVHKHIRVNGPFMINITGKAGPHTLYEVAGLL